MNRPEDPPGGKSHLTASDRARLEEILRRAADAQAMQSAQPQIENAINDGRSNRDTQPTTRSPKLPPAANLRLPQQAANRPTTTSASPRGDPFARVKSRPPSSLDPEIMPPPPEGSRRLGPILIGSIVTVGFAAIAAYVLTMFSFFQLDSRGPKSGSDGATIGQMSHEPARDARQRLVVEDQQAFANEPILLAVVAFPTTSSGSLSLRGLAHGTRLSAGAALDEDGWELSLRDIGSAYVYAPPDFVGVMNATIALLSPSNEVIDSRPIRLEWIAKANSPQPPSKREIDSETSSAAAKQEIDPEPASAAAKQEINPRTARAAAKQETNPEPASAAAKQEINPEPASAAAIQEINPEPASAAAKQETNPEPASAAAKQEINPEVASAATVKIVDPQEAAALMERGRDLLRNGDVASAQLAFRRLAEAGKADAALALATTYDPRYLVEHNLVGIVGDEAKARTWYRRAKELGSVEADRLSQPTSTK